ncbi:MAG: hypothetical protein WAN35_11415 [Terracidiphilus sp.]
MTKFICVAFLLACGVFGTVFIHAQSEEQETRDLKVFIAPLSGPDADLVNSIRAKLIRDFEKHGISVTETRENADAILSGSGLMQSTFATSLGHRPTMRIHASMRLVNKNGVALWAADVSSSRYAVSESSSFVEKVTEKVAEALSEESKRRNSEPVVQRIKGTN